jgi:hypothetical protein
MPLQSYEKKTVLTAKNFRREEQGNNKLGRPRHIICKKILVFVESG